MIKFGTGGWRAIIGEDFTKANIQLFAKAMADKMKAEKNDSKITNVSFPLKHSFD